MRARLGEVLRFLFPEYQIKASIDERGFFAKRQKGSRMAQSPSQVHRAGNAGQQIAPTAAAAERPAPLSPEGQSNQVAPPASYREERKAAQKAEEAFSGLSQELKTYWVGSDADRAALCRAFQRPYVRGFNNMRPKNSILILGPESRGKVYGVRCITMLLKKRKLFHHTQIACLRMKEYAMDSSNLLFLSDLYKALNTDTECVVFEDIDRAVAGQLAILQELMRTGIYHLSQRYMFMNGGLVEATGVLNTNLVSELTANRKFFIMTSAFSQEKLVTFLGNKFIKEIGDILVLDPLREEEIKDLVYTLCVNFTEKCKKNLQVQIDFAEPAREAIGQAYHPRKGVKGLSEYMEDTLYAALSEMRLRGDLPEDTVATLSHGGGFFLLLPDGRRLNITGYQKNYSALELEAAKAELDQVIGLAKVKEYVLALETNYKVQQMREGRGLKKSDLSMHMIFAGNPGTGKTTIARIVAKYLKAIGVLSSGQLREVTRADLVGQYVGHTAVKTTRVINEAVGGVLFIDEAYSLCRNKGDIFGLEAIDALVKGMEDNRNDLVVILAESPSFGFWAYFWGQRCS